MIAGIMAFLTIVSGLTCLAAWLGSAGLRRLGRPSWWVWLLGMAAPLLLLGIPLLASSPEGGGAAGATATTVLDLPPLLVEPVAASPWSVGVTWGLALLWATSSVGLLAGLLRLHGGLVRARRGWSPSVVQGREVLLTADRGPAVAGVLRPAIVLPRWVARLPASELTFVLLHEEEHLRARDTLVQALGLGFVVLTPWNPFTWLHLRGLRTAMEIDCDRRVLRRVPRPDAYGDSLLTVAARASGLSTGLAAFTEKRRSLETRIRAMTDTRTSWTVPLALLSLLVAVVVGVQACYVDNPVLIVDGDEETAASPANAGADEPVEIADPEEVAANPTFTPFTAAPTITNREEIVAAMMEEYPPLLRDAGVGGTVIVYFFIDENGNVGDVRIHESSGHQALDEAALAVAHLYRFEPARNRGEDVPVWVQFPITFQHAN